MSFETQEQSTESGSPIELYTFEGADTFRYTSAAVSQVVGLNTFKAIPMKRTAPVVSLKEDSGSMSIELPFRDPFALRYLGGIPPAPDTVIIEQFHSSDSTQEVTLFWKGSVSSVTFSGTKATVALSGLMAKTSQQIPSQTYSWMCDHNLFDKRCKLSQAAFTYPFTIVAVSTDGLQITLSETDGVAAAAVAADVSYFNGGLFLTGADGSQRMGLDFSVSGSDFILTLLVPILGVVVGQGISYTSGCDKSVDTCVSRYGNVKNYGGFPFVPTLNPHSADLSKTKER